jgi:hypothetical protein
MVSKSSSVTGDTLQQVGLDIPLRFIFKPSYSRNSLNTKRSQGVKPRAFMIRKIVISILLLVTVGLSTLTFQLMTMDYNENGVYFDGEVTYDTDTLLVSTTITGFFIILTIGIITLWKNQTDPSKS